MSSLKKIGSFFSFGSAKPEESVIGIDFGSSSIKIVQLKQEGGAVTLETYGELQLGPYAQIEVGRVTNLNPAPLITALTDIMHEAGVTTHAAGVAVPYASSFVTVISLPLPQGTDTVDSLIPIEARKYVPVPISQVTLDWFVIPDTKGVSQKNTMRVLIAAIHNEQLSKLKAIISGAHIQSAFNEIEIFSSMRSVVTQQTETVAILDIGAATTKLYVVSGGIVQATHSINVGGQDFTSSLSKALELDVTAAEELKRSVGLTATDNPRIERALSFPLERIFLESKRVLDAYERAGGQTLASVTLSGGGSALRGIEDYARKIFAHTIVRAHPFAKVRYPAIMEETLRDIGPSFAVALGVALRRIQEK